MAQMLSSAVVAREGVLVVRLKTGENLIKADMLTGSSDPYCLLRCGSDKHRSVIKYRNLNPRWDQTFEFSISPIQRVSGRLLIECRDHDMLNDDDFLGNATVELSEVPDDGITQGLSLALEGVSHGMINVDVRFVPVGEALNVTEVAARSASTNRLAMLSSVGAGTRQRLLKSTSIAGKHGGVGGPGGCFGGCFAQRTTVRHESFGDKDHGGKLTTTEANKDYN